VATLFDLRDPTVEVVSDVKGLGADPVEIRLKVGDSSSGLRSLVASVTQGEKKVEVLNRTFSGADEYAVEVGVPVDARKAGLTEGDAELEITVSDASLWSNSAEFREKLPVSFVRPRIEVLTTQQNSTVGGTELVVFRFVGRKLEESGLEAGGRRYPAVPAGDFDASLANEKGLYVVMFPLPYDFDPDVTPLKIYGRDDFGNVATSGFNYRIAKKKFPTVDMKLGDQFVNLKVPELLDVYRRDNPAVEPTGDHYKDFRLINEELRALNEKGIQSALNKAPVGARLWSGAFIRPLAAAPKAGFAEHRLYKRQDETVSHSLHMGIDLADVVQAKVTAANRGRVAFVGDLGIYGQTVIIDHGAGLSSLYGHLSAISVKDGQDVQMGEEIARTGATGLAGGDHLHFEVRVHGVPVSPLEWWDPLWIREHIEGKVRNVLAAPLSVVQ